MSAGDAHSFSIVDFSKPINVGTSFNIQLLFKDKFRHAARPPPDLKPLVECRWVAGWFLCQILGFSFRVLDLRKVSKLKLSLAKKPTHY